MKVSPRIARTILWVLALLSMGGLLGAQRIERTARIAKTDKLFSALCHVIDNVHENAEFRASTEDDRLAGTLRFINDPPEGVSRDSGLYLRVKQGLPTVRSTRNQAHDNVRATASPKECKQFEKEKS